MYVVATAYPPLQHRYVTNKLLQIFKFNSYMNYFVLNINEKKHIYMFVYF